MKIRNILKELKPEPQTTQTTSKRTNEVFNSLIARHPILLFTPFIAFSVMFYLFVYAITFSFGFFVYCFLLCRHVYRGEKPKYPLVPPEGRMDIPRPIYEDLRRYPEYFKSKRKKRKKK